MHVANKEIQIPLQQAVNSLQAQVYWLDRDLVFLGCNEQQAKLLGLSSVNEIIGRQIFDFQTKENIHLIQAAYDNSRQVILHQKTMIFEENFFLSDGSKVVFLSEKSPIFDEKGDVIGLLGISFDITEKKRESEKEIGLFREKAEVAHAMKIDFIRNMEHDIRTPVSGLFAVVNILMQQENDPDKKEMLEVVAMASKELLDYANSILTFSKIESESVPVLEKKFGLKKIIDSVVNLEAATAVYKKLEFKMDFAKNLPQILVGDAYRLKRVLINLISNAFKFTHQGFVSFSVDVAKQNDRQVILRFKIEDSGIGIPREKQLYIFEKFVRATPANEGIYKGFGLGLRIVKQFVREMEGEIDLKSHEGKGTIFICTFPFKIPLVENMLEDEGVSEYDD